jgi:formate dehydrogenase iron-sulfur subunit
MASMQSQDVTKRSATTTTPPSARHAGGPVAKLIDISKCIGCKACQIACMQWNDLRDEIGHTTGIYDNPRDLTDQSWTVMRFTEYSNPDGRLEWLIRKDGCMHCEDPGCLKACPAPGAIVKYSNGIVDFVSENCIGCGYCVGLEPACVKTCPTGAIHFGAKDEMVQYGAKRVRDLKERGFQKAGLYDPQGVGGTHVMYVLQHGDQPELYHGLPNDPKISPWVRLWKGITKPLLSIGLGLAVLGAFFHYVTRGPKEEEPGGKA